MSQKCVPQKEINVCSLFIKDGDYGDVCQCGTMHSLPLPRQKLHSRENTHTHKMCVVGKELSPSRDPARAHHCQTVLSSCAS